MDAEAQEPPAVEETPSGSQPPLLLRCARIAPYLVLGDSHDHLEGVPEV